VGEDGVEIANAGDPLPIELFKIRRQFAPE